MSKPENSKSDFQSILEKWNDLSKEAKRSLIISLLVLSIPACAGLIFLAKELN